MSRKELTAVTKKKINRTWDVLNLIACAVGGLLLAFGTSTPEAYKNITFGQVVGAILLATVIARITHLVFNEDRNS